MPCPKHRTFHKRCNYCVVHGLSLFMALEGEPSEDGPDMTTKELAEDLGMDWDEEEG